MEQKTSLIGTLRALTHWWRPILGICAIVGTGSIIVTLLMPNYYKASTIFLAASPDQAKPEVIFGLNNSKSQYYGSSDDIDRILTIGESKEIKEFLIDSFDLFHHYDIDTSAPKARHFVEKKISKYLELVKTKRDAIELSFEDKDREFAAAVANAARDKIDLLTQQLIKNTQAKAIHTLENNLVIKRQIQKALADTLQSVRSRYGIYNVSAQTESLSQQLAQATAMLTRSRARLGALKGREVPQDTITYLSAEVDGRQAEVEGLTQLVAMLNEGLGETKSLEVQYTDATNTMTVDQERLKRWQSAYQSTISAIILIQKAETPIVKSRPRRSILVLAAVLIAFIFSLAGVLMLEYYKRIDWNETSHAG